MHTLTHTYTHTHTHTHTHVSQMFVGVFWSRPSWLPCSPLGEGGGHCYPPPNYHPHFPGLSTPQCSLTPTTTLFRGSPSKITLSQYTIVYIRRSKKRMTALISIHVHKHIPGFLYTMGFLRVMPDDTDPVIYHYISRRVRLAGTDYALSF